MSDNLCEGPHVFTEQSLIGFKSGRDQRRPPRARYISQCDVELERHRSEDESDLCG